MTALHAVRIKVKRARYAAELAQPVVGKPARRFIERAKDLQDLLGDHQDAVTAQERLRKLADSLGDAAVSLVAGPSPRAPGRPPREPPRAVPQALAQARQAGPQALELMSGPRAAFLGHCHGSLI